MLCPWNGAVTGSNEPLRCLLSWWHNPLSFSSPVPAPTPTASMGLWGFHQCTRDRRGPVPEWDLTSARQRLASSPSCPYLSSLAIRVDQAQPLLSKSVLAVPITSLYFMCLDTTLRRACSICLTWDRRCLLRRCSGQWAALILYDQLN